MKLEELAAFGGKPLIDKKLIVTWPAPCLSDLHALATVTKHEKYHRVNHPIVLELEEKLAFWSGWPYTRILNSGTAAIHICIDYYKNKKQKVLVSALNWPGAVSPLYISKIDVEFVDVNLSDGCIDEENVLSLMEQGHVAGVMNTHLFGNPSYLKKVRKKIAKDQNFFIIDDCAQAIHMCEYLNCKSEENYSSVVVGSGNGSKHLGAGELGFICSQFKDLIDHVDSVSLSSSSRNSGVIFNPKTLGYNYRPNVFSASVALSRLKTLKEQILLRQQNVQFLKEHLTKLPGIIPLFRNITDNSFYHAPFRLDFKKLGLKSSVKFRDFILMLLEKEGLPVSVWIREPVYKFLLHNNKEDSLKKFPNTEEILNSMFSIADICPPNDLKIMKLYVLAFEKVWNYILYNQNFIYDYLETNK